MKKKALKKILTVFLCIFLLFAVTHVALAAFAPISWEAGGCAGGYKSSVIYGNEEEIEEALGINLTEKQLWQIKENWVWRGRNSTSFFTDSDGNEVKISGKKIWNSFFKWSYA